MPDPNPPTRFQPRKRIRLPDFAYQTGHAFLVTICTHERHPWFGLNPSFADAGARLIARLSAERSSLVFAWCFMPDHVHLLVQDADVVTLVRRFKGGLTPEARRLDPARPLWQRSFHDHALRWDDSVNDVANYIWENPVRTGLVQAPTEYPGSGSTVWPNWKAFYLSGEGRG